MGNHPFIDSLDAITSFKLNIQCFCERLPGSTVHSYQLFQNIFSLLLKDMKRLKILRGSTKIRQSFVWIIKVKIIPFIKIINEKIKNVIIRYK